MTNAVFEVGSQWERMLNVRPEVWSDHFPHSEATSGLQHVEEGAETSEKRGTLENILQPNGLC